MKKCYPIQVFFILPTVADAVVVALSPKLASAFERDSFPMLQRLFRLFGSGGKPWVIPLVLVIVLLLNNSRLISVKLAADRIRLYILSLSYIID